MHNYVTIIVPIYNVELYLKKCIESIIEQTYPYKKVLLIDDGSTDGSGEICDEYAKKYDWIRVIHSDNRGVSSARNIGIKLSDSRFIIFVDPDDYLKENHIELLMRNNKYMPACSYFDKYKRITRRHSLRMNTILSKEEAIESVLDRNGICGFSWNKLFDTRVIAENGIYFRENFSVLEDMIFAIEYICASSKEVILLSDATYMYRKRKSSIISKNTKSFSRDKFNAYIQISKILNKYAIKNNKIDSYIESYDKNNYKKKTSINSLKNKIGFILRAALQAIRGQYE